MAISHVQPLLLLIASLLFVPALSSVGFKYCNKSGYEFGKIDRVEISPNPIGPKDHELNIIVYGHASQSIDKGTLEVYAESKDVTDLLRRKSDVYIKTGTNFVLSLPEVVKDVLEGDYKYVVSLLDKNVEKPIVKICVEFDLPTSASTLIST